MIRQRDIEAQKQEMILQALSCDRTTTIQPSLFSMVFIELVL